MAPKLQKPSQGKPVSQHPGKGPGRKGTVKQPIPLTERLKRLFTSLCAQIDGGHLANAIKTCDKILRLHPSDGDALQTKLFLLLQTEQYEHTLRLLDADTNRLSRQFERAYSLYRLNQGHEAKGVLQEIRAGESDHRGALHLDAQLSYREGLYQAAFDTYSELLDSAELHSEEQADIYTNLQASQQHLDFINEGYLRALDGLSTKVSTALESIPPPAAPTPSALTSSANVTPGTNLGLSQPVKKVRKSRIPPGVIPGVTPPPDPERWLKKSERSTFGQGKKRKGASGGATQGMASVDLPPPPSSGAPSKAVGKSKKKR